MAWVTKDSVESYTPPEAPKEYTKKEKAANWWHYNKVIVAVVIVAVVLFALLLPIMHLYNISAEAKELAILLIIIHNGLGIFLWTPAFVLPNALKAAGDARFVMITAIASMMCCRVAMAYVLGIRVGMGAVGVWIAMILDWICRIAVFAIRYRSGKWQKTVI